MIILKCIVAFEYHCSTVTTSSFSFSSVVSTLCIIISTRFQTSSNAPELNACIHGQSLRIADIRSADISVHYSYKSQKKMSLQSLCVSLSMHKRLWKDLDSQNKSIYFIFLSEHDSLSLYNVW